MFATPTPPLFPIWNSLPDVQVAELERFSVPTEPGSPPTIVSFRDVTLPFEALAKPVPPAAPMAIRLAVKVPSVKLNVPVPPAAKPTRIAIGAAGGTGTFNFTDGTFTANRI